MPFLALFLLFKIVPIFCVQQLSLLELPKETVICVFGLYSCHTFDGRDLLLLQHSAYYQFVQ
jgi:hypothetical protein